MIVQEITVNQDTVNLLEALHYEVNSRREVIHFMLTKPDPGFNKELFDHYNKEYAEFYAQYDMAKNELQRTYVSDELVAKGAVWNLDFNSCILTVTLDEEESNECKCSKCS